MIDIYIIGNKSLKNTIENSNINSDAFFHFVDDSKEKRRAYLLKNEWGAKLSPFIALYEDNVMKKGFYSEDDKDVINTLINYLNNESKN